MYICSWQKKSTPKSRSHGEPPKGPQGGKKTCTIPLLVYNRIMKVEDSQEHLSFLRNLITITTRVPTGDPFSQPHPYLSTEEL